SSTAIKATATNPGITNPSIPSALVFRMQLLAPPGFIFLALVLQDHTSHEQVQRQDRRGKLRFAERQHKWSTFHQTRRLVDRASLHIRQRQQRANFAIP